MAGRVGVIEDVIKLASELDLHVLHRKVEPLVEAQIGFV